VLGPLPTLYRLLVSVSVVAVFVGAGTWIAFVLPPSVLVSYGVSAGLVVGGVCAFLLVRDSHHVAAPHRVRRPHRR
jgi:hypothetical protein